MFKRIISTITLSTFIFSASIAASQAANQYKLDASHTAITWHISHFGFSSPSGKFMDIDGTLSLDEKNPEKSKIDVTINMDSMNSGVTKLDEHLKGKDFFDTATFKTATFVSNSVKVTGKNTSIVSGILTMHGVSKTVDLNVTLNKLAKNMFDKQTAGFTANTTIKRSDFGMVTYLPGLGDEVIIEIESEANLI